MKKFLILLSLFLICGCEAPKEKVKAPVKTATPTPIIEVDDYEDDNPIKISLYDKIGGVRKKITEAEYPWVIGTDIVVLSAFATEEDEISGGNIKTVWTSYWDKNQGYTNYHIGYHIKFSTSDGKEVDKNILKPEDAEDFFEYLQIYLYDDIHQSGGWYSHVEHMEEGTILTSIKLAPFRGTEKINTPIEVSVFTYKDDNDFKDGNYRGNSISKSIIKKA